MANYSFKKPWATKPSRTPRLIRERNGQFLDYTFLYLLNDSIEDLTGKTTLGSSGTLPPFDRGLDGKDEAQFCLCG